MVRVRGIHLRDLTVCFLSMVVYSNGELAFSSITLGSTTLSSCRGLRRPCWTNNFKEIRSMINPRFQNPIRLRCMAETSGSETSGNGKDLEQQAAFSKPPPTFDPSVMMPPLAMRPGTSRYESFYPVGKEAIDVESEAEGSEEEGDATNPFFVGYKPQELDFIWSVHVNTVGERHWEEEEEKSETTTSIGGGLHDLILDACREADEKKEKGAES